MIGHLDAADWQFVWNVGQSLLTGAIGLYIYFSQREQVRRVALDSLESDVDGRLDLIGDRLTRIEASIADQPHWQTCNNQIQRVSILEEAFRGAIKSADLSRVHTRIDQVDKELAELRGETKGIQHLLQTIDHHLRNNQSRT